MKEEVVLPDKFSRWQGTFQNRGNTVVPPSLREYVGDYYAPLRTEDTLFVQSANVLRGIMWDPIGTPISIKEKRIHLWTMGLGNNTFLLNRKGSFRLRHTSWPPPINLVRP
jgi:hypothetical protein